MQIKQHSKVKYLGCLMDETMSGEAMALKVIHKINNKLKFLYRKNVFLTPKLRCLLYNALIQPQFDYACSTWYPNLTQKLKHRIQTTQNKRMRFCLLLDKLKHISHEELECLNWLPVTYRFKQCFKSTVFKYFNEQCPNYLNEVFDVATEGNFQLRSSFQKLKCPFRNTNNSQYGPTFWNQTSHTLKRSNNLNTFKYNFKKYYLKELKNSGNFVN